MNPFPDTLHFDNAGMRSGRRCIVLTRRFRAVTSLGAIEVPAGFLSDGGSIPPLAFSLAGSNMDDALEDFVLHDYLYSPLNAEFSRSEADYLLGETTWNRGINPFRRQMFLAAVRAFGWRHFKGAPPTL
jgi:hypothetical protein